MSLLRLLMLALVLALPADALAQDPPDPADPDGEEEPEFNALGLKMTAEVAFDNRIQTDRWACAVVEVENIGEPVDGLLVIEGGTDATPGERIRYTRPIDVGRKARKRVFLYFEVEGWAHEWTVTLVGRQGRGAVLDSAPMRTRTKEANDVVLAVVGQDPMGITTIRETWSGAVPGHNTSVEWQRRNVVLSLAEPASLPDRWIGYNVVDVLIWPQPDPTGMSEEQLHAMAHYVGMGGTLVVAVTDGWQLVRDSALADLLPVDLRGASEVEDIDPLLSALDFKSGGEDEQPILIADARIRDDRAWGDDVEVRAADGEQVLWAVRPYGLGRVVFLAVDPSLRPIKGDVDRELFWRRVLWLPVPSGGQRDVVKPEEQLWEQLAAGTLNLTPEQLTGGRFNLAADAPIPECLHHADELGYASTFNSMSWGGGYYYGTSVLDTWRNAVRKNLGDIKALKPLPLGWIALFAAVYLLCIGPIDFLFLRLIGRQEWTWLTFPMWISLFFVAAVLGTTAAKGNKAVMTRLEVVDIWEPDGLWRGQSFMGVFASQRTDLVMRSVLPHSIVEPMRYTPVSTGWWGAENDMDEGFMKRPGVQAAPGGGALAYHSETWTMAYMQSAWVDHRAERGHFSIRSDGGGRVAVINDTDVSLYQAVLLVGPDPATPPPSATDLTYEWDYNYQPLNRNIRSMHLGPLVAGASAQVDLGAKPEDAQPVWPAVQDAALEKRPHDRADWELFREMPEFWDRRGHLDLTRQLMANQIVLVGFTSSPVEEFQLEGLDPVSEPRTLVRVVLGEDPRLVAHKERKEEISGAASVRQGEAGDILIMGSLDRATVEAVAAANMDEVRTCYERALAAESVAFDGELLLRILVDPDGYVVSANTVRTTLDRPKLETCVEDVVGGWSYPPPVGGGLVIVKYPFVFEAG